MVSGEEYPVSHPLRRKNLACACALILPRTELGRAYLTFNGLRAGADGVIRAALVAGLTRESVAQRLRGGARHLCVEVRPVAPARRAHVA